jgi:hypothetical protein
MTSSNMALPYMPPALAPAPEAAPAPPASPSALPAAPPAPAYPMQSQAIPYMAPIINTGPQAEYTQEVEKPSLGARFLKFQIEHPILSKIAMFIALIVGFIIFFMLMKWVLCDLLGQQWMCDLLSGAEKILSWIWSALKKVTSGF